MKPIKAITTVLTGDGKNVTVSDIAKIYNSVFGRFSPTRASIDRLSKTEISITCEYSAIDSESGLSVKQNKQCFINLNRQSGLINSITSLSSGQPVDKEVLASKSSANRTNQAIWRLKSDAEKTDSQQIIQIISNGTIIKSISVPSIEAHGNLVEELTMFQRFSWCPSGNQCKLLYVCKRKSPKFLSYFSSSEDSLGEEFKYQQSWGEAMTTVSHSILAIMDVDDNYKIKTIDCKGHSLAKPYWLNENEIISEAYDEQPKRLGAIYCNNRPSHLVIYDLNNPDSPKQEISIDGKTLSNLRVSEQGDRIIFSAQDTFGPHRGMNQLMKLTKTRDGGPYKVESLVENYVFIDSLPENCFTSDGSKLVFTIQERLNTHLCILDLEEKVLEKTQFPTSCVDLLDVNHDLVVARGSQVDVMPTLYVASLQSLDKSLGWHHLDECVLLSDIHVTPLLISTNDLVDGDKISAILVGPKSGLSAKSKRLPTVVAVHGGPCSSYHNRYMPYISFLTKLGLNVLAINYRGSAGVDEKHLKNLCGKVGDLDVNDCLIALKSAVKQGLIDPDNLAIHGGSHGGFLACHLSCQEEFKFLSAIIRNPVTDLASMYTISDIPDWVFTCGLGDMHFDPAKLPSNEELIELFNKSPISKVDKANVPTLMHLGSQDLRVPMSQGLQWVNHLKARGIEVVCKVYPDGHPLDKPKIGSDTCIEGAIFMLQHFVQK